MQQLREEVAIELATLQGRVDNLEANMAKLEANQFSTTTKLTRLVVTAITGGGFSGRAIALSIPKVQKLPMRTHTKIQMA